MRRAVVDPAVTLPLGPRLSMRIAPRPALRLRAYAGLGQREAQNVLCDNTRSPHSTSRCSPSSPPIQLERLTRVRARVQCVCGAGVANGATCVLLPVYRAMSVRWVVRTYVKTNRGQQLFEILQKQSTS